MLSILLLNICIYIYITFQSIFVDKNKNKIGHEWKYYNYILVKNNKFAINYFSLSI